MIERDAAEDLFHFIVTMISLVRGGFWCGAGRPFVLFLRRNSHVEARPSLCSTNCKVDEGL